MFVAVRDAAEPNQALQQTAAAILVPRDITALSAAAAAELGRSAAERIENRQLRPSTIL
jgi:hypothetical protein